MRPGVKPVGREERDTSQANNLHTLHSTPIATQSISPSHSSPVHPPTNSPFHILHTIVPIISPPRFSPSLTSPAPALPRAEAWHALPRPTTTPPPPCTTQPSRCSHTCTTHIRQTDRLETFDGSEGVHEGGSKLWDGATWDGQIGRACRLGFRFSFRFRGRLRTRGRCKGVQG